MPFIATILLLASDQLMVDDHLNCHRIIKVEILAINYWTLSRSKVLNSDHGSQSLFYRGGRCGGGGGGGIAFREVEDNERVPLVQTSFEN